MSRAAPARSALCPPLALAALAALVCCTPVATARAAAGSESAVVKAGRADFLQYCSSCHGLDARGNGPVAPALKMPPPDLTRIAARRSGDFPFAGLARLIDGREPIQAHGSREMPVWGAAFGEPVAGDPMRERIVRGQIQMLLVYLESIQR
jgi:mono/diheme cytochrome c family protein